MYVVLCASKRCLVWTEDKNYYATINKACLYIERYLLWDAVTLKGGELYEARQMDFPYTPGIIEKYVLQLQ